MEEKRQLTDEQWARIEATLRRIRGGLRRGTVEPGEEPAHLFAPEVHDAR